MKKTVKKIDIHVHSVMEKICNRANGTNFTTPTELRKMYDDIGIEFGVQLPTGAPEGQVQFLSNEEAYRLAKEYPETYAWFCNVDPRSDKNSPTCDLSVYLAQYKKLGAKGVGELVINLPFDHPLIYNLFFHCQKTGLPVIFHIGNQGNDYGLVDELGLPRLEKALNDFPDLHFIGHSQKFWAEISGDCNEQNRKGYPTGKVVEGGRIPELMRKYKNLSGDMSAGSGANAIMRDPEFSYVFLEEFQDRLYFGTDICAVENTGSSMLKLAEFLDQAMLNDHISYDAYYKISRGNALKLLERTKTNLPE